MIGTFAEEFKPVALEQDESEGINSSILRAECHSCTNRILTPETNQSSKHRVVHQKQHDLDCHLEPENQDSSRGGLRVRTQEKYQN